jgi:hypothetical protein
MVQDRIDFEKFGRFPVRCYTLTVTEMHVIADWFKPVYRNNTAKDRSCQNIIFFAKYDHSVGFCIIPISMKSASTTYISSVVTGFLSRILDWNKMLSADRIFCSA